MSVDDAHRTESVVHGARTDSSPRAQEAPLVMISRAALLVVLVTWFGACSSTPRSATPAERRDATVMTRSDLETSPGRTLYDHIRRVRPQWLSTRGPTTLAQAQREVVVYRDGIRIGGIASLRDMITDSVESVRYLSGPEASSRFGLDHQHGAILVTTRR